LHQGDKVNVYPGDVHVMKHQDVSLFLEPSAPSRLMSIDLTLAWMEDKATLDEWIERLVIIRNSNDVMSLSTYHDAELFSREAREFKTPDKRTIDTISVDDDSTDTEDREDNVQVYKRKIENIESFIQQDLSPGELSRVLYATEVGLERATKSLKVTRKNISNVETKINQELPVLFSRHESLESTVGSRLVNSSSLQGTYQTSTLWGSVSLLSGIVEANRLSQLKTNY
jgi:hypothetical protein